MAKKRSVTSHPGRRISTTRVRPRQLTTHHRRRRLIKTSPTHTRLRRVIVAATEHRPAVHIGLTSRKILSIIALILILILTNNVPVRTFFTQRAELQQQKHIEAQLHTQISQLRQQQANLNDPVYIKAQARERLGFIMPGEIPFQVQLSDTDAQQTVPSLGMQPPVGHTPWYSLLWRSITDIPAQPEQDEFHQTDNDNN